MKYRNDSNDDPLYSDPARNTDRDLFTFITNPYVISTKLRMNDFDYSDEYFED
jgi:hypothetical protein